MSHFESLLKPLTHDHARVDQKKGGQTNRTIEEEMSLGKRKIDHGKERFVRGIDMKSWNTLTAGLQHLLKTGGNNNYIIEHKKYVIMDSYYEGNYKKRVTRHYLKNSTTVVTQTIWMHKNAISSVELSGYPKSLTYDLLFKVS